MLILGLDPGTATVGYGLLNKEKNKLTSIKYGCILTPAKADMGDRLVSIGQELEEIIREFNPDEAAIEKLFFMKNVKTAISVSQARGVMLMTMAKEKIKFYEYTPLQVKLTVTGYGQANKLQVQKMVRGILGLSCLPQPDDAADALAIAICHSYSNNIRKFIS